MATQATKSSLNGKGAAQSPSVEDLSAQIDTLKGDIAKLTTTMKDLGVSKAAEAQGQAKDKVESLAEAGREKALETQLHAEEFIRTQPGTALGIAAGVGFLVGLVTARR